MNRLLQLLRHAWADASDVRRVLDDAAADRLHQRVVASEARHRGEIRLCIEAGLPLRHLWQQRSVRDRALDVFAELRVWDTEANNGVLIYLLLAERAIEIVADRGVAARVPPGHWAPVLQALQQACREGRFEAGLMAAIDAVEATLQQLESGAAPAGPDVNELPDRPLRR